MTRIHGERRQARTWAWNTLVDMNPVLAKELVVTARTPVYIGAMILATLLLAALVYLGAAGVSLDPLTGARLFPYFFSGLTLIVAVIGASLGSTVLVQEREGGALDALKFTSLPARTIAVGKFAAVMLGEVAVVACASPLLVMVLALPGVSLGEAAIATAIALTTGAMTAAIGLGVSAHAANARRALLLALLGAGVVGIAVTAWLAAGSDLGHWDNPMGVVRAYGAAPWTMKHVALLAVGPACGVASVLGLGYAATTSGLMDASEDKSLPIKGWMWMVIGLGAIALDVSARALRASSRDFYVLATVWMVAVGVLALVLLFVFAGEPVSLTRRMAANPASPLAGVLCPRRLAPSVMLTVVWSGLAIGLVPVLVVGRELGLQAVWAVVYLAAVGGLIGSTAAWLGRRSGRIAGAIAVLAPLLFVALFRDPHGRATWVDAVCPLWVMPARGLERGALVESVSLWAALGVASLAVLVATGRRKGVAVEGLRSTPSP